MAKLVSELDERKKVDFKQSQLDPSVLNNFVTIGLNFDEQSGLVPCGSQNAERKVKVHAFLLASRHYTVIRVTTSRLYDDTNFTKLAKFTNKEWAVQYTCIGHVPCKGACMHDGQCKQKMAKYNNSAEGLCYVYFIVGKGKIRLAKERIKIPH
jgi:hypothetical protein